MCDIPQVLSSPNHKSLFPLSKRFDFGAVLSAFSATPTTPTATPPGSNFINYADIIGE